MGPLASEPERFDCCVLGAGPAGAAAALSLARSGRRVALVDRPQRPRRKLGEALPSAARPLLRKLGVLAAVEAGPHLVSPGNLSAWGREELEATDFLRDPYGLGWHLDRAAFDTTLRRAAVAAGAVDIEGVARQVRRCGDGWRLVVGQRQIEARWLVDATGRSACVARRHGGVLEQDDDLYAVYTYARCRRGDSEARTLIEAAADGWWYTARLPDDLRVVIFHTDKENAASLLERGDFAATARTTKHLAALLPDKSRLSTPRIAAASGAALRLPCGDGWVAAGDAAIAFDPLSSQGIFNALYSGLRAGEAVSELLAGNVGATVAYVRRLREIRDVYLARRAVYYGAASRWAGHSFWRRRVILATGVRHGSI